MQTQIQNIRSETRRGSLFINLSGTLNLKSAMEIKDSINRNYNGRGNVFFNVEKLNIPHKGSAGRRLLAGILSDCCLPAAKFYLIGQEGFSISPEGCRVIVRRKKECCGKCQNCHC